MSQPETWPSMQVAMHCIADACGVPARHRNAAFGRMKFLMSKGLFDQEGPGRGRAQEVTENQFLRLQWGLVLGLVGLTPEVVVKLVAKISDEALRLDEQTFAFKSPYGTGEATIVVRRVPEKAQ
jgi:hypothetical protein